MNKNIDNKFNRIVKNTDPQELEDKLVNYSNEIIDDILNGNSDEGFEKMRNLSQFFKDHQYSQYNTFFRAWRRILAHMFEVLTKSLKDAVASNQKMKLYINLMGLIDLMYLNIISELIKNYQEEKHDFYLKKAMEQINELRTIKLEILDRKIFPESFKELEKIKKEYPEYNESINKEFVNEVLELRNVLGLNYE